MYHVNQAVPCCFRLAKRKQHETACFRGLGVEGGNIGFKTLNANNSVVSCCFRLAKRKQHETALFRGFGVACVNLGNVEVDWGAFVPVS